MTNARLEELRAKFQENPRRYFAPFANELRKTGDSAQAIAVCRTHLAGQPGHVSGHIVLGQALYEAGESGEAREIFTAALELDPENLIALRSLGEIAQVNGEFSVARQWYERLLDADPRNTDVAQLLKDLPMQAPPAPAPAPLPEAVEEPTPLSVRLEAEAAPPAPEPIPRPLFHTSFSGSGPAYDPDKPAPDVASSASASEEAESAFIDLEPTAHEDHEEPIAQPATPATTAAAESLELVDFTAPAERPELRELAPDEVPEFTAAEAEPSLEAQAEPVELTAAPAAELDGPDVSGEQPHTAEFDVESLDVSVPTDEADEAPRALFAEHGFEGPVDDEAGWISTPSAAYSDLEAAPETWLDESAALEAEDVMPPESAAPTEMTAGNPATDSWFDDVEGAAEIESTEITTDEFWLPPELPQVTSAEVAPPSFEAESEPSAAGAAAEVDAETHAEEPQLEEVHSEWAPPVPTETVASGEAPDEVEVSTWSPTPEPVSSMEPSEAGAPEPVASMEPSEVGEPPAMEEELLAIGDASEIEEQSWMSAASAPVESEPSSLDAEAIADAGEDAVVVEHPAEVSSASTWSESEAVPSAESEEAAEPPSMETGTEVIFAGAASTAEEPRSDAVIGRTPESASESAPPAPAPFITETLAELYLQQGFREEALAIYRQLSERDPDDPTLRNRIAAIEQGESPRPARVEVTAETRAASQSVRTFFSRLARRPAVTPSQVEGDAMSAGSDETPEVPFASAASALANLFAASRPPASDESAASTLAGAFTDPAGRPSRAAERELSLDHLFRDVPSGGSPAGGVTLDEFYATPNAAPDSPTESREAEGSEDSGGTDIRQFTAWLEGLRKK